MFCEFYALVISCSLPWNYFLLYIATFLRYTLSKHYGSLLSIILQKRVNCAKSRSSNIWLLQRTSQCSVQMDLLKLLRVTICVQSTRGLNFRGFRCLSSHPQIFSSKNWAKCCITVLKMDVEHDEESFVLLFSLWRHKHERALLHISLAFVYPCVETSRMSILELNRERMPIRNVKASGINGPVNWESRTIPLLYWALACQCTLYTVDSLHGSTSTEIEYVYYNISDISFIPQLFWAFWCR